MGGASLSTCFFALGIYSSQYIVARTATAEPPIPVTNKPAPIAAAGKITSPIGAATHRNVARWLIPTGPHTSAFDVYAGSTVSATRKAASDAGSPGSIATGV